MVEVFGYLCAVAVVGLLAHTYDLKQKNTALKLKIHILEEKENQLS